MRAVLCVVAVLLAAGSARAELLVRGAGVIYREATDDYLFRVRFSDINRFPELSLGFTIYGHLPSRDRLDTLGGLYDKVHDDEPATLWKYIFPTPPDNQVRSEVVATSTATIDGNTASVIVSRSDIALISHEAGDNIDLLFKYHVNAHSGVRYTEPDYGHEYEYQYPFILNLATLPRATLNIPEPSTLSLAAIGSLFVVAALYRRRSRR